MSQESEKKSENSQLAPARGTQVFEGLSVQLTPASIPKRIMAFMVDISIIYIAVYLITILTTICLAVLAIATVELFKSLDAQLKSTSAQFFGIGFLILLAVCMLGIMLLNSIYFIASEYKRGSTAGKRLFGLKVVSLDGSRLSLSQCIVRDLLRIVDCYMILPGLLSIILTERRQRLGDLLMGTMVVYSKEREQGENFLYVSRADYNLLLEKLAPGKVPESVRKEYLSFANRCFLLRKESFNITQHEKFISLAKSYLSESSSNFDAQTISLFFAEHCFQLSREKNTTATKT